MAHEVQHHHHRMLSVWFFIGILLFTYGVIITFIGVRDYHRNTGVMLAQYHAPLWGGILLLVLGTVYTGFNWPRKGDM